VEVPGCHGARLTGAGFGGCIIALVEEGAVPALKSHLLERYETAFDREAAIYDVHPAEGVERMDV
jgi:galactokinase